MLRTVRPPLSKYLDSEEPKALSMYRAAVSRSAFLSLFARTATWRRSRSASARPSSESGGSGPVWERPGIAIMYRIPAAKSRPRMTSAVKKAMVLLERVFQLGDEVVNVLDADRQAHQALVDAELGAHVLGQRGERKSTRLNSSHSSISYAVFCLKKKK